MSADLAQRAASLMRICPTCAGLCREPYNGDWADPEAEMIVCRTCNGCGDWDLARLRGAYMRGRREGIAEALSMLSQTQEVLSDPSPPHVTARLLRHELDASGREGGTDG